MELMNKSEAAEYLRISVGGVNRRLAAGELVPVKIGGLVFFRREILDQFIKTCERKGRRQARERQSRIQNVA